MKCSFCGGDIDDGVRKCKHCGEWQSEEDRKKAAKMIGDAVQDADNTVSAYGCLLAVAVVLIFAALKSCG